MTFSQDEINLMCIYDTSDKTELLKELRFSVPYIEDTELKEITETVIDKLERMTNDEFSKLSVLQLWHCINQYLPALVNLLRQNLCLIRRGL